MASVVWMKDDIRHILTALHAACEGPAPYDRGRRRGIELAAASLGLSVEQLRGAATAIIAPDANEEIEEIVRRGFEDTDRRSK